MKCFTFTSGRVRQSSPRTSIHSLILISVLLLLTAGLQAQYPWVPQNSGVTADLVAVSFVDDERGFIATAEGDVLHTFDGGVHWYFQSHVDDIVPTRMVFTDYNRGWLTGNYEHVVDSAAIFHTTDGGVTWQPVFQHLFYNFYDIQFLNDTTGWVAGCEISETDTTSVKLFTTTEGFFWTKPLGPRVKDRLFSIHFRDEDFGTACGQDGLFFSTYNGGMDQFVGWSLNIAIPYYQKDLYRIFNSGSVYGCAVGEAGFFLTTSNNWTSVQDHTLPSADTLHAVTAYTDIPQFYAVGNNGCVASIRYALFMWMISEEARVTDVNLNDICQVDDQHAWAVGDNGTILFHTNNFPPVAVNDVGSVRQDSSLRIYVLANDTDPDFDPLKIYSWSHGKHGVVVQPENADYLDYFPDDNYVGMDSLQYIVTDSKKGFDTAYVYIEIRKAPTGPFTQVDIPHDNVAFGNAIWGDIDNDDDYDIVVFGEQADGTKLGSVFFNNEGSFEKSPYILEGIRPGNDHAIAFTDLDMNGYLDFIVTGEDNEGNPQTRLYIYNYSKQMFDTSSIDVPGLMNGSVDWGDYDRDGDPDLLVMGTTESGKLCEIYKNNGRPDNISSWSFTPANVNFHGLDHGTARFIDFNHDQYMDVINTGLDDNENARTYYYTNLEGLYVVGELPGYKYSTLDYCDFNADGSWDILQTGTRSDMTRHAALLSYNDSFNEISASLNGVSQGSASWGDFDNDGDPDLVICGMNDQLAVETQLYINNQGVLENSGFFLPGMASGTVEWGDYDADGDLDLLMSGYFNTEPNRITTILRNDLEIANEAPTPPDHFSTEVLGDLLMLHWNPGTDAESPLANLAYNITLKKKKSFNRLIAPASYDDLVSEIPGYASVRDTLVLLSGLNPGRLYECKIQSIDAGFHVSPWAKFEFNAPSMFFEEQDLSIEAHDISASEWFYIENDTLPTLLLRGVNDSSSTLLQWNGSKFDTLDQEFIVGSGYGQLELLDFNMDNVLDYSELNYADNTLVIYISGGDTLHVPAGKNYSYYDWGDYDRDGDPDLILTGDYLSEAHVVKLFRNDGSELVELSTLIPGVIFGDIAWVDIDADGDNDVAVTGYNMDLGGITRIYENRGGGFIEKKMGLPALNYSSFDFADYDGDGDMDILICGLSDDGPITKIYANNAGIFNETSYGLAPIMQGSCKWVDLLKDGKDDIVLLGNPENDLSDGRYSGFVYIYYDNKFNEVARMNASPGPIIATGDYDSNGILDLAFAGSPGGNSRIHLYRNMMKYNTGKPHPPRAVSVLAYGDSVKFTWKFPNDVHYSINRLMFNMRVGSNPGGSNILSPLADETGNRKVFHPGNIPVGTSRTVDGLSADSIYYAAVQSVDPAFIGSPFTNEIKFNPVSGTLIPVAAYTSNKYVRNATWVDIDSDKDPDLMVDQGNSIATFENDGENMDLETPTTDIYTDNTADLLLVNDYDNDNDADVLLLSSSDPAASQMLENESGEYSASPIDMTGLYKADAALGDLNNDGRMDAVIMGEDVLNTSLSSLEYIQNEDGFESWDNLLETSFMGEIHMVDFDVDGDLDLIRCGHTENMHLTSENIKLIIDKNMDGTFLSVEHNLPGLNGGSLDFGDYDNDGDPDMLYTGYEPISGIPRTYICDNNRSGFVVSDTLVSLFKACGKWFDYNNDGHLDIILSGYNDLSENFGEPDIKMFSGVFLNWNGSFELAAQLPVFHNPVIAVADYDMDGRQDIFIGGYDNTKDTLGILYQNMTSDINLPPGKSQINTIEVNEDSVKIDWFKPFDSAGGSNMNYYNLRIGTEPGSGDVLSPLSHADGTRIVYNMGNMQQAGTYRIGGLEPSTTYYVAVQVIDKGMTPSAWSDEESFTTVGVEEHLTASTKLTLEVYPVPAQEEVFLKVYNTVPGTVDLEVFDLMGRLVVNARQESRGSQITFHLSLPKRGLYLVKLRSGNEHITGKFVVTE